MTSMEKLIFTSSNPIPSKLNLKPRPSLPRLVRFAAPRLGFSSAELRRLNSFSCKHHDSPRPVSCPPPPPSPAEKLPAFSPLPENLPDGKTHFIQQFTDAFSQQQKAVAAGSVLLLSALFVILVQPIFVSPAFASFQTATKTGPLVRSELLSSAWTGFLAGCLHTLSGPDHLAALAPLSIGRTRVQSALVGALWGCGHDAGQVIFGLLFLLLKDRLHIEIIRTWGTRVVGFTLLVIGAMGIREASEASTHYVVAVENGPTPCLDGVLEVPAMEKKKKVGLATFATGIIHGLQPDALMMVLPALALPSRVAGAAFLGMFLVGTVVAMGSYTVFIGSCSQALKDRVPRITEKLTWASSLVAIALGCGIIISQFFGFSLY